MKTEKRKRRVGEIIKINVAFLGNSISCHHSLGGGQGKAKEAAWRQQWAKEDRKCPLAQAEGGRELDVIQVLLPLAQLVSQCQHGISPGIHGLVGMAKFAYFPRPRAKRHSRQSATSGSQGCGCSMQLVRAFEVTEFLLY